MAFQRWHIECLIALVCFTASSLAYYSACTPDFVIGTCSCNLINGGGSLDLSPLVEQTKDKPLAASDAQGYWVFYLSFCSMIVNSNFSACTGVASVCQTGTFPPVYNGILGEPGSTRFEMRNSSYNAAMRVALVTGTVINTKQRYVAFLNCVPDVSGVEYVPKMFNGDTDPDGYSVTYGELNGRIFCPVGGTGGGGNGGGNDQGDSGSPLYLVVPLIITAIAIVGILFVQITTFMLNRGMCARATSSTNSSSSNPSRHPQPLQNVEVGANDYYDDDER